jgi:hypothetical protein
MSYNHHPGTPDWIWQWAQQKSGLSNPSSFIREILERTCIADIQGDANHSCDIPDWIWQLLQQESGLSNPSSFIREILERTCIASIQGDATIIIQDLIWAQQESGDEESVELHT